MIRHTRALSTNSHSCHTREQLFIRHTGEQLLIFHTREQLFMRHTREQLFIRHTRALLTHRCTFVYTLFFVFNLLFCLCAKKKKIAEPIIIHICILAHQYWRQRRQRASFPRTCQLACGKNAVPSDPVRAGRHTPVACV